jgi:hypothetical protein
MTEHVLVVLISVLGTLATLGIVAFGIWYAYDPERTGHDGGHERGAGR